MGVVVVLHF